MDSCPQLFGLCLCLCLGAAVCLSAGCICLHVWLHLSVSQAEFFFSVLSCPQPILLFWVCFLILSDVSTHLRADMIIQTVCLVHLFVCLSACLAFSVFVSLFVSLSARLSLSANHPVCLLCCLHPPLRACDWPSGGEMTADFTRLAVSL